MDKLLEQIAYYVQGEVDGEITEVEENCGSIWITTDTGQTFSILVTECEQDPD